MSYEQIWAPWRLAYIQEAKQSVPPAPFDAEVLPGGDPTCFLCQAAAEPARPERMVVHAGELTLVVLNRFPYNNGHLLVAPRRHVDRLDGLSTEEHLELSSQMTRMVGLLERTLHPDGFNAGLNLGRVAGAGLPGHLHWHVVPRWHGDTNFMPVLANVHVIPQSLEALWALLQGEIHRGMTE